MPEAPDLARGHVAMIGRTAFERALNPHLPRLRRLGLRLTGSRDDAEDLIQDLLTHLYPRAGTVMAVEDLGPWLRRVLYRQFVDRWRRRQADPVDANAGDIPEAASDVRDAPDAVFDRALDMARLQRALDSLPLDHRSVILLHDVEGYTLPEVSQMTDTPEGTLKSRLHRARNRLRARLLESDGTNPGPTA